MTHLTTLGTWTSLQNHYHEMRLVTLKDLHAKTDFQKEHFQFHFNGIHIDFSNQRLNKTTLKLLLDLAAQCNLKEKILALLKGEIVNRSEHKAALHTALRVQNNNPLYLNGKDIIPGVLETRHKMEHFSNAIRNRTWFGFSGKPITDIVNIGIGGSDLGPRFCLNALKEFTSSELSYHFISDVDPLAFFNVTNKLQPETTLFIISSKSFTTKETLYNANKAFNWIGKHNGFENHFIAVTANQSEAEKYGIHYILPIWEWVGGRYSVSSAINLITAIAIGFEHFNQFLAGANCMDEHFSNASLNSNLPVMLALVGIWNNNFFNINNLLTLVYTQQLEYLVPYIQQLEMESNGKSIDNEGQAIDYDTAPLLWGGLGNQAQHSYYQLLCQGTRNVTVDFVTMACFAKDLIQDMYRAKKQVLSYGVEKSNINNHISGNLSSTHIQLKDCTPYTFGSLVALYEHKTYVQSVIWNINPFDQPGVENAKNVINAMINIPVD